MSSLEGEARMARPRAIARPISRAAKPATACASTGTSPIAMDDGLVLRADVFRPVAEGRYPVDPELWALCQGARLPGRLSKRLGADGQRASRRRRRLEQPLPELGSGRSGKVGAARLRLRARRFARRRLLARLSSIISRRARPRIFTTASNGPACSRGRTARSGSTAFPTTASISGTWRRCSRRILPPCASGKAPPTGIAT